MSIYKHLFFDLDNTVWDFNRNSWYALKETFRQYELDEAIFDRFFEAYERHNDYLWEEYRNNRIVKQDLARLRFELTFNDLGIKNIDGLTFNDSYLGWMPLQTRLCDGAREVLEKLSKKYELHIITNGFMEVQHKKLANSGLDVYFKRMFISEEIKSPKPAPEIFHHALKSSNARKKESLMIGDSWEVDILGAMEVGIDQIHYAPFLNDSSFTKEESDLISSKITKTLRINHLSELFNYLHI